MTKKFERSVRTLKKVHEKESITDENKWAKGYFAFNSEGQRTSSSSSQWPLPTRLSNQIPGVAAHAFPEIRFLDLTLGRERLHA